MVDHTNDQSTGVQSQEGLLHDVDPSLTETNEVAKALDVDTNTGLSSAEAQRRLEKFGPNQLASAPPVPKWKKFLAQFQDPLVYLLLAATVISLIAWFIERSHGTAGEVLPFRRHRHHPDPDRQRGAGLYSGGPCRAGGGGACRK